MSRDNARTPMQWSGATNAGFTSASAKPWLAINPNCKTINADQTTADPDAIYNYIRALITLRAKTPASSTETTRTSTRNIHTSTWIFRRARTPHLRL